MKAYLLCRNRDETGYSYARDVVEAFDVETYREAVAERGLDEVAREDWNTYWLDDDFVRETEGEIEHLRYLHRNDPYGRDHVVEFTVDDVKAAIADYVASED